MKITECSVSYGRTINLGNFNSLRAECTLTAIVEEGDTQEGVCEELREKAREQVRLEVERLTKYGDSSE